MRAPFVVRKFAVNGGTPLLCPGHPPAVASLPRPPSLRERGRAYRAFLDSGFRRDDDGFGDPLQLEIAVLLFWVPACAGRE